MVLLLFQLLPSKMILALLPYVQKISKVHIQNKYRVEVTVLRGEDQ